MSGGAPGFLEFFILEASDYVEQLDGLLLGGDANGPDAERMQRVARALRGTATMAKIPSFADVAAGVERVGRALQEGAVRWEPSLGGALVAAIDDLKTLLHAARTWSPADDERASNRAAELSRLAPARPAAGTPAELRASANPGASGDGFLATEAANIAAGLELLTTRAGDADTAGNVLRRVRALRGVAGVKEVRALADVLESTEEAARGLESRTEELSDQARSLLAAAADYLRAISAALRDGGDTTAPGAAREAFLESQARWAARHEQRDVVVPIAELFYADGAPNVLETAAYPPTSAAARFQLELVSLGEHLRQLVSTARRASDPAAAERTRRDFRRALRAVQDSADSFGEGDVSAFIATHLDAADDVDEVGLATLDDLAALLSNPGPNAERLRAHIESLAAAPDVATAIGAGFDEKLDNTSAALIDSSIAAMERMPRFSEPVPLPEDLVVPIDSLLYRGRAALDRAVELRDDLRRSGVATNSTALDELFDLLELARAE